MSRFHPEINQIYPNLKHVLTDVINDSNMLKNQCIMSIEISHNYVPWKAVYAVVCLFSNIDI